MANSGYRASPAISVRLKGRIFDSGLDIPDAPTTDERRQRLVDRYALTVTSLTLKLKYIAEQQDQVESNKACNFCHLLCAVMSFDIPSVAEIQLAAERGQRITQDDVSSIAQAESALTGRGPSRGGPAGESRLHSICKQRMTDRI